MVMFVYLRWPNSDKMRTIEVQPEWSIREVLLNRQTETDGIAIKDDPEVVVKRVDGVTLGALYSAEHTISQLKTSLPFHTALQFSWTIDGNVTVWMS